MPTRRASLCVPPNPGMIPRPHSGCPNTALSEAIRISHAIEISHPPPKANPLTAAIVTCLIFINLKNGTEAFIPNALASAAEKLTISAMSAPATKDLNSLPFLSAPPVKITTLISSLPSISVRTVFSSSNVSEFNAFNAAGLVIVRTAISFSTVKVKLFMK